jgi:hypothetical protein
LFRSEAVAQRWRGGAGGGADKNAFNPDLFVAFNPDLFI